MHPTRPIKLFITGLCLQGNKGGPALALAMRDALSRHLSLDIVTLSVPGGDDFINEQRAASRYGFNVVESIGPKALLPPLCFMKGRFAPARAWLSAFLKADIVVDMTAISYVGPPVANQGNIFGGRFFYFVLSRLLCRNFLAWTQSYGPLSTPLVTQLAKFDLQRQPIVFCRGDDCANVVRGILPQSDVRSFPDVATILPFDRTAGHQLLERQLGHASVKLVTISPSAVIYSKTLGKQQDNAHVIQTVRLCDWLTDHGYDVALVPHTLRLVNVVPENCDLEVCRLIHARVKSKDHCTLITDDIGANELKGIIANAVMHVGGRYHSIVAALSAGVPCISLSWHPKYKDLMRAYGMEQFVFDATANTSADQLVAMIETLARQQADLHAILTERQAGIAALVEENARVFSTCVEGAL